MKSMKNLILSLLLCAVAQGAWADYITNIKVIGYDSSMDANFYYGQYTKAGWIGCDKDLNDGAGGHYIYLVFQQGNSGTPITDLYLYSGANPGPATITYYGRTYYRVGVDGDDEFKNSGGDLNCGAEGNWIYLYYTTDPFPDGRYLNDIFINNNYEGLGANGGSSPGNLNEGAGGQRVCMQPTLGYTAYGNWDAYRANSFSHVDGKTIYIENEAELALLAYNVNNGNRYYGTTFVLNRDLDLSDHWWIPIGNAYNRYFMGNFDGRGHTITGIRVINSTADWQGLFGLVRGSAYTGGLVLGCRYIKNLVIKNSSIKGQDAVGGVVGAIDYGMTLENVFCEADVTGRNQVGGIVGDVAVIFDNRGYKECIANIRNCLFLGGRITANSDRGAVAGKLLGDEDISYSNNYYVNPDSYVGNSRDVRAYPISLSLASGVTVNSVAGVTYDGKLYHPAGEVNFSVAHNLKQSISVTKNGYYVSHSKGIYSIYNFDPADNYVIEVATSTSPHIFDGNGTQGDPYLIKNQEDWNYIVNYLSYGEAPNDLSGVYFKLDTDITVNQRMGTDNHPFCGIFDGGGHKLTLDFGDPENYLNLECAPFYLINNATIKNLVIDGSIYSSAQHNGGIAVKAEGDNNHIQNCISSVSINSSIEGDCTNGGFIGILDAYQLQVYFNGCAFTGELVGENATNWGGFVGWRKYEGSNKVRTYFTDCLFAPTNVNIATPDGSNSRTFCRSTDNTTGGADYNNCYYTTVLQAADCGEGFSLTTAPANIGNKETEYDVSDITRYANGIKYGGRYYTNCVGFYDNASNADLVADLSTTYSGQQVNVMLTDRTLYRDGDWNTLCLPFDVELQGSLLQGGEARTLSEASFSDGTLTLNFSEPVTTTLNAGTPYIIKWNATDYADLVIKTTADWDAFADAVNNGNNYSGKTVLLTNDIDVETMVGTNGNRFKGTFNGNGHTLNFTKNTSEQYCAPFRYVENATIMNLHTVGTIITSKKFGAGIVAYTKGATVINNCWSSVDINSSVSGDGSHGGIVGYTEENASNTTLTDCLFDGSITGENTNSCGGLIGWNYDKATLTNCVFRPTSITLANSDNATFSRGSNVTVTNCYYSQNLPGASGQGTAIGGMTNEALLSALGSGWTESESKVAPMTKVPDIINPVFNGVTINATASTTLTPTGDGKVSFIGIYNPETLPGGNTSNLYLGAGNQLYWPTADKTVNAFRAYFNVNGVNNVREIRMNFGDEVTGVTLIDNGQLTIDNYAGAKGLYNLSGQKVSDDYKGIVIKNGKKYVKE